MIVPVSKAIASAALRIFVVEIDIGFSHLVEEKHSGVWEHVSFGGDRGSGSTCAGR
jgi:hypothetical protein